MRLRSWIALAAAAVTQTHALHINGWYNCSNSDNLGVVILPFECAKVEMPLCHDGICTASRQIEVFVKRIRASATHVRHDGHSYDSNGNGNGNDAVPPAMWFLEGGPGASSVGLEIPMYMMYGMLNRSLDVYTVDHRGTGRSEFMQCDAAQAMADGSPSGSTIALGELSDCIKDVLFEIDNTTAAFSVTSAATDIAVLLKEFTRPKQDVFVYGVSYGTYLVERLMHLAPPQVTGYILDGILSDAHAGTSSQFHVTDWNHNILAPSKRFFQYCADDPHCPLRFHSRDTVLEEVIAIYDQLDEDLNHNICAQALVKLTEMPLPSNALRSIFGVLVRDPVRRVLIPSLLVRLQRCGEEDQQTLGIIIRPLLHDIFHGMASYSSLPSGLSHTTTYAPPDFPQASLRNLDVDRLNTPSELLYYLIVASELWSSPMPSLDDLVEAYDAGPFSQDETTVAYFCALTGVAETDQTCLDLAELIESPLPKVQQFTYTRDKYWNQTAHVPDGTGVLYVGGGLDFQTPRRFGEAQYETTEGPNRLLVEFQYGVHGSAITPTTLEDETYCGPRILASFIRNRADVSAVDTSCLASLPPLRFSDDVYDEYVKQVIQDISGFP
ncbi:TPA: hypothetical protein N0F65_009459 [Lagenidium giganteum]|uniref:AB hydrolase-1 domain-containing protein n=1 Tax=Lagenidium giganteum TaxID=4803 RepID=A0AAV2ZE39_9STRA|nr:TPA: hypothetical protein N0F65_009459 [Lagenidium giganteum]